MTTPQAVTVTVPQELIDELREATAVTVTEYTDMKLGERLALSRDPDGSFNVDRAAAQLWTAKAATFAELVDVDEGGSSRKLGSLHKNAMAMAAHYGTKAESAVVVASARRVSRTRAIVRD